jgi:hypothetical protein
MGVGTGIRIESDFKDYYDKLSDPSGSLGVYRRFSDRENRVNLLKFIRSKGYRIIPIKAVKDYGNEFDELVVYTDPTLHDYEGKRVMSIYEARLQYINYLAAPFYRQANGETSKFLQVGTKRFLLKMKNDEIGTLKEGRIVDVIELELGYNYALRLPIFSLDYINVGHESFVVDFNRVQNLEKIGFDRIMTAEEVMEEIKKAVIAYN